MRVNKMSFPSAGALAPFYNCIVSTCYGVFFSVIAVKGRSRSSAPRLPPINADRMRTAKALVEKAVKVIMRRIFYPSAVRSDSLYLSFS